MFDPIWWIINVQCIRLWSLVNLILVIGVHSIHKEGISWPGSILEVLHVVVYVYL